MFSDQAVQLMNIHPETFLQLSELGSYFPEFRPTFEYNGNYIDDRHEYFATCPATEDVLIQIRNGRWWGGSIIEGWLRRADALKLYEMAYSVEGDILELGCYHGLSTTILSQASRRSPNPKRIYTIDLNQECIVKTRQNLRLKGLSRGVTCICAEATGAVKSFSQEGKKFGFAFIDHSHAYDPVLSVCRELYKVMEKGGFCLFHDFNDARNRDSKINYYGVYQAVTKELDPMHYTFYGIYGCTALYRVI